MPWDTAARRQALIDTAMSMLPHPATAAALLDEFFTGPVHLCWYVMDERTFRAKHAAFEAGELDPSWLALYLIVLAITTKVSPNNATHFPGYSEADVELIPTALYQSSLNALEAAEYLAIPQVRHIQCAILYVVTLFHFGDDDDDVKRQNIVLRHLDAAVSTLLWLDLDIMSDNWNAAPLDDPALAGLSPHAAHELCKQLVHIVQFMDTTIPRRRSIWRLMNITTSIPANRKVPSDMDYPELPSHVVTPAGLPRSANAFCVALRKYGNDSAELTHEETMVYDAELRSALALVPPPASLDTSWMLHMVITSVHNRILRAHRPFLMRSVNDPSLEVSRRACVESARRIVEAQLVFNAKPKIRPRFAVRWVIGAVVVLAMDYVLGNMDSRTSLLQARDVFLSVMGPRGKHCVKALDALVYAADVKTGTVSADTDLGTFFDLVKEKLANTEAPQGAMNMLFPGLEEFDFEGMLSGEPHAV
ncbi:hypothetical protein CspHIS471_0604650 [Cutaneotrichosporon sp. HIS471]|nr:hypothetical protein CspHIS471_0604650 [Cutaneotrichosporon sp. HIS471]